MIMVFISQFYPPDMAMGGYVRGGVRRYVLGGAYSGYELDSVVSIEDVPRIGCVLPTGSKVVIVKSWNPDSLRVDTFYAYYNTFYFVEFFKKPYFGLRANLAGRRIAIRSLKFPIVPGDRWPAYDWCGVQPGDNYEMGDMDGNGRADSIVFLPSQMWYAHVSLDTDTVITSGTLTYALLYSFLDTVRYVSDTNYWILFRRVYRFWDHIHFVYVRGVGYVEYKVDSSTVEYLSFIFAKDGDFETVITRLDSVRVLHDLYSRTMVPLNVSEEEKGKGTPVILRKGRVYIGCDGCTYKIYDVGGRIVVSGKAREGTSVPLKPGVYFVRVDGGTYRIVVR